MAKKTKSATETVETVTIRRAPKFAPIIATFALFGAAIGVILYMLIPHDSKSAASILGYLVVFGMLILGLLGAGFSLLLDWFSRRAAKQVEATKLKQ